MFQAFKTNQLCPDIIKNPPSNLLEVIYKDDKVNLGNELTPTQVRDPPEVKYEADSNDYYTLLFTDPDAPSRNNHPMREWHHWLVSEIFIGKTLFTFPLFSILCVRDLPVLGYFFRCHQILILAISFSSNWVTCPTCLHFVLVTVYTISCILSINVFLSLKVHPGTAIYHWVIFSFWIVFNINDYVNID